MANRTVQFYGQGIDAPASIVATFDGQSVFTGSVPTNESVMFTAPVDSAFIGTKPVSIQVTSGTLLITRSFINYACYLNPIFTPEQRVILDDKNYTPELRQQKIAIWTALANPAFSDADLAFLQTAVGDQFTSILLAHNVCSSYPGTENTYVSPIGLPGDSRSNIYIDGVQLVIDHRPGQEGDSSITVNQGSTVTFDFSITNPANGI
jgi:hypothetical protein